MRGGTRRALGLLLLGVLGRRLDAHEVRAGVLLDSADAEAAPTRAPTPPLPTSSFLSSRFFWAWALANSKRASSKSLLVALMVSGGQPSKSVRVDGVWIVLFYLRGMRQAFASVGRDCRRGSTAALLAREFLVS